MTLQRGKQAVVIHGYPNISRSKDIQSVKFGHLIEYNMRITLLVKSYMKCGGETSARPFCKKSKVSICGSLDQ